MREREEKVKAMVDVVPDKGARSVHKDDFMIRSHTLNRSTRDNASERRMHLRAFDYWHDLRPEGDVDPEFDALTPDGLSPFKDNSLLLEIVGGEGVIRFCGSAMYPVFGQDVARGATLSAIQNSRFADALMDQLLEPTVRLNATEFEFEESGLECRGILLPFSAAGQPAKFLMVVVNHRPQALAENSRTPSSRSAHEADGDALQSALSLAARECGRIGATVVHPDSGSRDSLYNALAETYRFHIAAARDPVSYRRFLGTLGLKQQRRAPFTPALKLTFGKDYDKTRLTEYAAALSYAARCEIAPDALLEFLKAEPGGIKGCVQKLRDLKRKGGPVAPVSASARKESAKTAPAKQLHDITLTEDFDLILARRSEDGKTELLGASGASRRMLDQTLTSMAARGLLTITTEKDAGK